MAGGFFLSSRFGGDLLDASPRCGEDEVSHTFFTWKITHFFFPIFLCKRYLSYLWESHFSSHLLWILAVGIWVYVVKFRAYQVFFFSFNFPPARRAWQALHSFSTQMGTDAKSPRHFVENETHHLPIPSPHSVNVRCFMFSNHSNFFYLIT